MLKKVCLLFILVLLLHTICCMAGEQVVVSVVFSFDIDSYQEAWKGFIKDFDQRKASLSVSQHNLEHEEPAEVISRIYQEKPNLLVTLGTKASKLAKEEIYDIPTVFCMVFNAQEITGENITGVSMEFPPQVKLRAIREILPDAKRIGLIYSEESVLQYEEMERSCRGYGFELIGKKIENELPKALVEISDQMDCFLMIPDSKIYFSKSVEYLLLESLRNKFPVVGLSSVYTKAGALFSLDCDYGDLGRQAAEIALKILNLEKPGNIKPASPRKTNLSLNLSTAKRLGIKVSPHTITNAKEVFGK